MNLYQAAIAVELWETGQFDTLDIARAVEASEADVCRLLHEARDRALSIASTDEARP